MAEKRLYTIPLRDAWNVSIKKRSKGAMAVIRAFTAKHMKTDSVKIGSDLNHLIWSRGIKNPPRKVKVQMVPKKKDDTETIWVDLVTSSMDYLKEKKEKKPKVEKKEEAKPEDKKTPEGKAEKKVDEKSAVKKEEKKPEAPKKPEDKKKADEPVKKETAKPADEKSAVKAEEKKPEPNPKRPEKKTDAEKKTPEAKPGAEKK